MCCQCRCEKEFSVPGSKVEAGETITIEAKCDCDEKNQDYVVNKEKSDTNVSV